MEESEKNTKTTEEEIMSEVPRNLLKILSNRSTNSSKTKQNECKEKHT